MTYAHIHRFHKKKKNIKKRGNKCVFGELFAKIKRWDLCYREKKLEINNLENNKAKESRKKR
jgi:hypothetical protein